MLTEMIALIELIELIEHVHTTISRIIVAHCIANSPLNQALIQYKR